MTRLSYLALGILIAGVSAIPTGPDSTPLQHVLDSSVVPHSRWTTPPHPDATHSLIFQAASGLLQHWSNTAYPNGHSLASATIPPGTLMYHGTSTGNLPPQPDWISFDPEHAILFTRAPFLNRNGTLFTLAASRPLNVLYLDGNSGGKTSTGTVDSQVLLSKGEVTRGPDDEHWTGEFERAKELCAWGKTFHIDAFIRMEFDFEAIVCDFYSGLDITSALDIPRPPERSPPSKPPPNDPLQSDADTEPDAERPSPSLGIRPSSNWRLFLQEHMIAGAWYNPYPGLPFVVPDYSRFITLFDPTLAPSLLPVRRQVSKRRDYRLLGLSEVDAKKTLQRLEEVLSLPKSKVESGVRWDSIMRNVKDRYKDRLDKLKHTLHSVPSSPPSSLNDSKAILEKVKQQLRVILNPYVGSVTPPSPSHLRNDEDDEHGWATPVFTRCSTALTAGTHSTNESRMTREELVLRKAIEGTVSEICRVAVLSWAELSTLSSSTASLATLSEPSEEGIKMLQKVRKDVDVLIEWLGWPEWITCEPACGDNEFCWIPEWMPGFKGNATDPMCIPREREETPMHLGL